MNPFYMIVCYFRKEHDHAIEVMIDKNTTRNYCKCGHFLEFDWSYVGGYKKSMSKLSEIKRKNRWN